MGIIERIFGKGNDFGAYRAATGSGELGDIIKETEDDHLERWLNAIENRGARNDDPLKESERQAILKRDGTRCVYPDCDTPTYRLQIHHLRHREFGGGNDPYNLATVCLHHHAAMHPGLNDAFDKFRKGDKNAFKEYVENNKRFREQPVTRIGDVIKGIVYERQRQLDKGK